MDIFGKGSSASLPDGIQETADGINIDDLQVDGGAIKGSFLVGDGTNYKDIGAPPGDDYLLLSDSAETLGAKWLQVSTSGIINGGANVGSGLGTVYRDETAGGILNYKTLDSDGSIVLTNNADEVKIQANINDAGSGVLDLWSADKITTEIASAGVEIDDTSVSEVKVWSSSKTNDDIKANASLSGSDYIAKSNLSATKAPYNVVTSKDSCVEYAGNRFSVNTFTVTTAIANGDILKGYYALTYNSASTGTQNATRVKHRVVNISGSIVTFDSDPNALADVLFLYPYNFDAVYRPALPLTNNKFGTNIIGVGDWLYIAGKNNQKYCFVNKPAWTAQEYDWKTGSAGIGSSCAFGQFVFTFGANTSDTNDYFKIDVEDQANPIKIRPMGAGVTAYNPFVINKQIVFTGEATRGFLIYDIYTDTYNTLPYRDEISTSGLNGFRTFYDTYNSRLVLFNADVLYWYNFDPANFLSGDFAGNFLTIPTMSQLILTTCETADVNVICAVAYDGSEIFLVNISLGTIERFPLLSTPVSASISSCLYITGLNSILITGASLRFNFMFNLITKQLCRFDGVSPTASNRFGCMISNNELVIMANNAINGYIINDKGIEGYGFRKRDLHCNNVLFNDSGVLEIKDNDSSGLIIKDSTSPFITCDSTTGLKKVLMNERLESDLITTKSILFNGNSNANIVTIPNTLASGYKIVDAGFTTHLDINTASNIMSINDSIQMGINNSLNTRLIDFDGTNGTNKIRLEDNLASALQIDQGANNYMTVSTTNGNELVTFNEPVVANILDTQQLRINNGSFLQFVKQSSGADYQLIFPANQGSTDQILKLSNGTGSLEWATDEALVNPMTSTGDIIVGGGSGVPTRLGVGSDNNIARVSGGTLTYSGGNVNNITSLSNLTSINNIGVFPGTFSILNSSSNATFVGGNGSNVGIDGLFSSVDRIGNDAPNLISNRELRIEVDARYRISGSISYENVGSNSVTVLITKNGATIDSAFMNPSNSTIATCTFDSMEFCDDTDIIKFAFLATNGSNYKFLDPRLAVERLTQL